MQDATDVLDPCDPKLAGEASGGDAVVVLAERGVDGGPCYEHRGAAIHANVSGTAHKYHLAGMPGCEGGRWLTARTLYEAVAAIDKWLDV